MLGSFAESFFELIAFDDVLDYAGRNACVANPDHYRALSFMLDNEISIFSHFIVDSQDAFSSNHEMPCVFINVEANSVALQDALQNDVPVGEHPEDVRAWEGRVDVQPDVGVSDPSP